MTFLACPKLTRISVATCRSLQPQSADCELSLNCWILSDSHKHIFIVNIRDTQKVAILKDLIKEKKSVAFQDVDWDNIELWKVSPSIAVSSKLEEHIREHGIVMEDFLLPLDRILEIFPDTLVEKNLHVVAQAQFGNKGENLVIIAVCSCFGTSATIDFFEPNLCELFLTNHCTNEHDFYSVLMRDSASICLYTGDKSYIDF